MPKSKVSISVLFMIGLIMSILLYAMLSRSFHADELTGTCQVTHQYYIVFEDGTQSLEFVQTDTFDDLAVGLSIGVSGADLTISPKEEYNNNIYSYISDTGTVVIPEDGSSVSIMIIYTRAVDD